METDLQIRALDFWLSLAVEMSSCLTLNYSSISRRRAAQPFSLITPEFSPPSLFWRPLRFYPTVLASSSSNTAIFLFDLSFTKIPGREVAWQRWRRQPKPPSKGGGWERSMLGILWTWLPAPSPFVATRCVFPPKCLKHTSGLQG